MIRSNCPCRGPVRDFHFMTCLNTPVENLLNRVERQKYTKIKNFYVDPDDISSSSRFIVLTSWLHYKKIRFTRYPVMDCLNTLCTARHQLADLFLPDHSVYIFTTKYPSKELCESIKQCLGKHTIVVFSYNRDLNRLTSIQDFILKYQLK